MTELNATGLDLWGYAASLRSSEGNLTGLSYQGTVNNSLFPSMWEYFRLGLFLFQLQCKKQDLAFWIILVCGGQSGSSQSADPREYFSRRVESVIDAEKGPVSDVMPNAL